MSTAAGIAQRFDEVAAMQPGWLDGDGIALDQAELRWLCERCSVLSEDASQGLHILPAPDVTVPARVEADRLGAVVGERPVDADGQVARGQREDERRADAVRRSGQPARVAVAGGTGGGMQRPDD